MILHADNWVEKFPQYIVFERRDAFHQPTMCGHVGTVGRLRRKEVADMHMLHALPLLLAMGLWLHGGTPCRRS